MIRERHPRTDDAEIIRLIQSELIPISHTAHPKDSSLKRSIPQRLREGKTFVTSRHMRSKPTGFIHLIVKPQENVLLIDMLAIHRKQQGKQFGKLLMAYGEAYGASRNCRFARLFVDEGNDRAHHFYTRLGYQTFKYYSTFRCYELLKPLLF